MTPPTKAEFGRTSVTISRLGLGTWAFGGTRWGDQEDAESLDALARAFERGVDWVDTAGIYGLGHAERLVGTALREFGSRPQPLVFTKGGLTWDECSDRTIRDAHPETIRRQCEESLERLGVARLDLYQLHWPPDDERAVDPAWELMGDLVREGLVRWTGLSNFSLSQLERCEAVRHVDAIQVPMSMVERNAGELVLDWANDHGTAVIAYSPMGSGLLTGAFTRSRAAGLAPDDWRAGSSMFRGTALSAATRLVDGLSSIAERLHCSIPELAVAWVLAWPGVTGAAVGARTGRQVDGWLGAADLVVSESDLDEIAQLVTQSGLGAGPARPPRRDDTPR